MLLVIFGMYCVCYLWLILLFIMVVCVLFDCCSCRIVLYVWRAPGCVRQNNEWRGTCCLPYDCRTRLHSVVRCNIRDMGGAPRNPAPRNHFFVWIVKPSGCRYTDAFGGKNTPSPPTKSLGFRGFDSSRLFILRGGNYHIHIIV